jgi:hypothetical protein
MVMRRTSDEGGSGFAADGDDEVVGGGFADVFESVEGVGGGEEDAAGADAFELAVVVELDGALADHDEFGVDVTVGRVGHVAGEEGGLVELDGLAGGENAAGDGAGFAVGGGDDGEVLEAEGALGGKDGVTGGAGRGGDGHDAGECRFLGFGRGRSEGGDRGQGDAEVAAVHAGNITPGGK